MKCRLTVLCMSFVSLIALGNAGLTTAQVVPIPNPSFEQGENAPEGWALSAEPGSWLDGDAADGRRAIAVTGDGHGTNYWRSASLPLAPLRVYRLVFQARRIRGTGGTPISGPLFCNRDLGSISEEWTEYRSIFVTPQIIGPERAWLKFGQWHVEGTVAFDHIALTEAQPIYAERDGVVLGEGERLQGRHYLFTAPYRSLSRNHSRALIAHNCTFNTNRWVFGKDSYVVYRHRLADRVQTRAEVEVQVNYYTSGALMVEASAHGETWHPLGTIAEETGRTFAIPADLLPGAEVWIRLRASETKPLGTESDPGSFQVNAYEYRAELEGEPLDLEGATRFVAVSSTDPRLRVHICSLGDAVPGGKNVVQVQVENTTVQPLSVEPLIRVIRNSTATEFPAARSRVKPGTSTLRLPYELPGAGAFDLEMSLGKNVNFQGRVELYLAALYETAYGKRLPGSSKEVGLWWASSGWKVSRTRPVPKEEGKAVLIRAAKNETEAAQLVLRPATPLHGLTAKAGDLTGPNGALLSAGRVDILRVRYVEVKQPTDPTGVAAPWPDPLPPFRGPIEVPAGTNQPLWVRVHIPTDAVAGVYTGHIQLRAKGYEADAPLEVEVYNFKLPRRMTCTTSFGFSFRNVVRYQKLTTPLLQRAVLERYLEDFSAHHISPYDPAPLDPFKVTWEGLQPHFDWTAWDAAMEHAIDDLGFNAFVVPIQGMGGGTYHDRRKPTLLGYSEDTPSYRQAFRAYVQAVQEHLREKGWLDKAYVYWFDEPEPKDYAFVMNGFRKLRESAPDLRRMLTEQVEGELVGGPNIWCPVSYAYDFKRAEPRRRAGDTFWWYVCTGPKAPYATLFIDHPATELRVWLWQTWKNKIEGILVWQTNYWTSGAAYPKRLQNPYEDPMSWTSGYSTPAGVRRPWGNGDGRFIYPPEAAASGLQDGPVLDGPVDSIRWEMLRDGIEDYEYFVLLRRLLAAHGDELDVSQRAAYEKLLEVPKEVSESTVRFTLDPAPIQAHRHLLARAIEALSAR